LEDNLTESHGVVKWKPVMGKGSGVKRPSACGRQEGSGKYFLCDNVQDIVHRNNGHDIVQ